MDVKFTSIGVGDLSLEVGEGVNVFFFFAPVLQSAPFLLEPHIGNGILLRI